MNVTKQETWHTDQEIYGYLDLEQINSVAFLEVKLLGENSHKGWENGCISIRCLVECQKLN